MLQTRAVTRRQKRHRQGYFRGITNKVLGLRILLTVRANNGTAYAELVDGSDNSRSQRQLRLHGILIQLARLISKQVNRQVGITGPWAGKQRRRGQKKKKGSRPPT